MQIVGFVLFGLLIGAVTNTLVATEAKGQWSVSMLCGIAGATVGGFFGRVAGLYGDAEPAGFVMALLGAFTLVAVYHAVLARRSQASRKSDAD